MNNAQKSIVDSKSVIGNTNDIHLKKNVINDDDRTFNLIVGTTDDSSSSRMNPCNDTKNDSIIHPMTNVPDAIRIVLFETARWLVNTEVSKDRRNNDNSNYDSNNNRNDICASNERHENPNNQPNELYSKHIETLPITPLYRTQLLGQTLALDIRMSPLGYPPYHASIADGYAVHSSTIARRTLEVVQDQPQCTEVHWTHRVVRRIYTGDSPSPNAEVNSNIAAEVSNTQVIREAMNEGSPKDSQSSPESTSSSLSSSSLPEAYYVTTGAVVPDHCDCVVPVEEVSDVSDDKNYVSISIPIADNSTNDNNATLRAMIDSYQKWIRLPGSDIAPNSIVLRAGQLIDPIAFGLLLQSGNTYVSIRRRITVGVLSTGNELFSLDSDAPEKQQQPPYKGMIPDVNRPILMGLLETFNNCNVIDLGICRDDNIPEMVRTIRSALDVCTVIITTGGVSVGETDVVEHVLTHHLHGTVHFGRLNMKPGKPTKFVTVPHQNVANLTDANDIQSSGTTTTTRFVFALPGNPCSAVTCTHLLVRPCLDLLYDGPNITNSSGNNNHSSQQDKNDTFDQQQFTGSNNIENFAKTSTTTTQILHDIVSNALVQPEVLASLKSRVKLDSGRPEYHRVKLLPAFGRLQQQQQQQQQHSLFTFATNLKTSTNIRKYKDDSCLLYDAISTGMQRSSRLPSMLNADALLLLPKGRPGMASVGGDDHDDTTLFLAVRHVGFQKQERVTVRESIHMNMSAIEATTSKATITTTTTPALPSNLNSSTMLNSPSQLNNKNTTVKNHNSDDNINKIFLVQILPCTATTNSTSSFFIKADDNLSMRVSNALNGITSSSPSHQHQAKHHWTVVQSTTFARPIPDLYPFLVSSLSTTTKPSIDVILLVGTTFPGSFGYHVDVSNSLRTYLTKHADSMAQTLRRHCASASVSSSATSPAALFETVIGFLPNKETTSNNNNNEKKITSTRFLVDGAIVVFVSDHGLDEGLLHIREVLRHAVRIAREGQ